MPEVPAERIIMASAPIRVCDIGGWTDTWFARTGSVLNVAINPSVDVQLRASQGCGGITIDVRSGVGFKSYSSSQVGAGDDPLLHAAIAHARLPQNVQLNVCVRTGAVLGSSTGTSAAMIVALLGALNHLSGRVSSAAEVASQAHYVETQLLGRQSGVQDQLAAAFGGINFIDIHDYPHASVSELHPSLQFLRELERRHCLVFVGESHRSSAVHEMVIRELESMGGRSKVLKSLRECASRAKEAIAKEDFRAFGDAMIANTTAQGELNEAIVGALHRRIIAIAKDHAAWGWKVNGAGGTGGSLSILCGQGLAEQQQMLDAIRQDNPAFQLIPTSLNMKGLRVQETIARTSTVIS